MKITNFKAPVTNASARIKCRVDREFTGVERHCRGQGLESGAHLIGTNNNTVDGIDFLGLRREIRVKIRQGYKRDDFTGCGVKNYS